MKKEKISLVIPCYNEEEVLPIFYDEIDKISKSMKKNDFEFLFINDGSKDKTLIKLRELSKIDKRVRYISFSRNFGKEAGIYAGLSNATGDYVAIMDADMQDPPEMIEKMYKLIQDEGYDCVGLKAETNKNYPFFRKLLTKLWYKLIGKIAYTEQIPGVRDFRLMKRKMVDAILEMSEYNRYSKGIFSFVGFDVKYIDYKIPKRIAGETKFNFWKLFTYAVEGILGFSTVPLLVSAIVGILFCIISFIAIIFIIIKTLIWNDPTSGWPSLVCILFFLSGIQLFCMGILGAYLSKTYLETKKRPIYIVKETEKDL